MTDRRGWLAVLAWHKIGVHPPGFSSWGYVSESLLTEQLRTVLAEGWTVIDAAALVAGLDDPGRLPDRAALLTFDDGYRSMLSVAAPILQRHGLPAVCFVPTDYVGRQNSFDAGLEPPEPICGWHELADLEARGVAIESHGTSHGYLSRLSTADRRREARESKRLLEGRLGKRVRLFAYPYSDCTEDRTEMGKMLDAEGFRAAFLCDDVPGVPLPIRRPWLVHRLAMAPDTDLRRALRDLPLRGA